MRKSAVAAFVLFALMTTAHAGDLDLGAQLFGAIGQAIFSATVTAVDYEVGQAMGKTLVNNKYFSALNNQALRETIRHDLKLLLGTESAPVCYATCPGGHSTFEEFKQTKLYSALLDELKNEDTVRSFYDSLNRRESLRSVTASFVSRAANWQFAGDVAFAIQKVSELNKKVTAATLIAANDIVKGEEKALRKAMDHVLSLQR